MKPEIVHRLHRHFEDYVRDAGGVEFWYARDLQTLLGYKEWRNFMKVIDLLEPYLRGGKVGLFGGAGVGKTTIIHTSV